VLLSGLGMSVIGHEPEFAPAERPYVSPEQLAGRDADARSDVFGLASLVHHALVGTAPAPGGTPAGGSVAHGAPAELGVALAVLDVARSADPAARHPTVKAFWEDLLSALVSTAAAVEAPAAARAAAPAPVAQAARPAAAPTARESRRVPADAAAPARAVSADLPPAPPATPVPAAAHGRNPLIYAAMGGLPVALVLGFLLWPRGETVAAAGDPAAVPAAVIDAAAGGTTTVQSATAERDDGERAAAPATSVRAARRAPETAPEPRHATRGEGADHADGEPRSASATVKLPDVRLPVVESVDTRLPAGGRSGSDELSQRATVRASEFTNGARLRAGSQ
jgi:hypothetical protein